ncbi:MAG: hypothetical protein ACOCX1_00840 [Fimbriimonadaceae bacterium]
MFLAGCEEQEPESVAESAIQEAPVSQEVPAELPEGLPARVEESVRLALEGDTDALAQITSSFAAEVAAAPPDVRAATLPEELEVRPADIERSEAMAIARFGAESALRSDVANIIAQSGLESPDFAAVQFDLEGRTYTQVWLRQGREFMLLHPPLHVDAQAREMIEQIGARPAE